MKRDHFDFLDFHSVMPGLLWSPRIERPAKAVGKEVPY
jgi:hypothetical protein